MSRILIVDSEPHLCTIMQFMFEHAGHTAQTALTAYEAMTKLVGDELPDAVVIGDLRPLPETTLALVNDVRVAFTGTNLPIVVVSTQVRSIDRTCCLAAGADRYLAKPFRTKQVVAIVESLIQRSSEV